MELGRMVVFLSCTNLEFGSHWATPPSSGASGGKKFGDAARNRLIPKQHQLRTREAATLKGPRSS